MIYGRISAEVVDENGRVRVTITHDLVTIKQEGDLIRLTRANARILAQDILDGLDEFEARPDD